MTPHPCAVCNRAGPHFAFRSPDGEAHFCSFQCSEVYMVARAAKIELTKDEAAAVAAGGRRAGAYLEGIGKTDLAEMTREEWAAFCGVLVAGYVADLQNQADEAVPF